MIHKEKKNKQKGHTIVKQKGRQDNKCLRGTNGEKEGDWDIRT